MFKKIEEDRIAYKFLKTMGMGWINLNPLDTWFTNKKYGPFKNSVFHSDFPKRAATEITNIIFTPSEQRSLTELIAELKKQNPALIERARAETERKTKELGRVTHKVFAQIPTDVLNLLGLIGIEEEYFSQSRKFFSQMLNDLGVHRGKRYQSSEIKNIFSQTLGKLEELVNSLKNSEPNQENEDPSLNPRVPNQEENNKKKEPDSPLPEKEDSENIPTDKLAELIQKGEKTDNLKELKKIVEQIEGFRGEKSYETLKERTSDLKKKLANQDIKEYCKVNWEMVDKELKQERVKKSELNTETQKELEKLKKGEISQGEVETIKDKISNEVKLKGAAKKLEKMLKDYQKASPEKKKEILNQITSFINSPNSFYQEVYRQKKNEIDNLLKTGSSSSSHDSSLSKSNFSGYPEVISSAIVVTGAVFILIIRLKNKKKIPSK